MRVCLLFPLVIVGAGCTPLPELGPSGPQSGHNVRPPKLVPIESLLALASDSETDPEQAEEELNARVAALNAKADRLRADPDAL